MNKREKIKNLLSKLTALEKSIPNGEVSTLSNKIIKDELLQDEAFSEFAAKIQDNTTIRYLNEIYSKINELKKSLDFSDLEASIEDYSNDIEDMRLRLDEDIKNIKSEQKKDVAKLISMVKDAMADRSGEKSIKDIADLMRKMENSRKDEMLKNAKTVKELRESVEAKLNEKFESMLGEISTSSSSRANEIEEKIKLLRSEVMSKVASHGGNMNRNILVDGVNPLTRYTDINFIDNGICLTPTNDNTNKVAKFTIEGSPTNQMNFHKTVYFDQVNNGNAGTAKTIDWRASNKQTVTLNDSCIFTFTDPSGPCSLILKMVHDGTADSYTQTFPGAVNWVDGTPPTFTNSANAVDIVSFYFDGSEYYATYSKNFL